MKWSSDYKDGLVNSITQALVDSPMEQPVRRVAQEDKETKEELKDNAIEHAKTYWMLGWTWDEIEALLEDMEYPSSAIKSAIKEAQLYAVETLKDGPYGRYKYGQLVKLKNKSFARVVGQNKDGLMLADLETGESYSATMDLIFEKRSQKLTEAFLLRRAASEIRKMAAPKQELDVSDEPPGVQPYNEFTPHNTEEKSEFIMTPTLQKSKGWEPETPEDFYSIDEASEEIGTWVNILESLHMEAKEVKGKIKELKKMQKEELAPLKDQEDLATSDIDEAQQAIIGILSEEENVLDQMDEPVFKRFEGLIVGLYKTVSSFETPPGPIDEFNLLMDSLEAVLPKTKVQKVLDYFDNMKKIHTLTTEVIETKGILYKAPEKTKEKVKGSKHALTAGMWDNIKSWFSKAWKIVTKQSNDIIDDVLPSFDEASDLIEEFMSGMQAKHANKQLSRMFR